MKKRPRSSSRKRDT